MPANSQGQLSITDQADGVATYTWSPQTDYVTITHIPSGGIELTLPADAQSGDEYGWQMGDSSISESNPVTVLATGSQTVGLTPADQGQTWTQVNSSARLRFDQETDNWSVIGGLGPRTGTTSTAAQTLLGTTQGPAASVSAESAAFTPLGPDLLVTAVMSVQASAAGTGVTFVLHRTSTSGPQIGPSVVVGSAADTNHQVTATIVALDTGLTELEAVEYFIVATASTGTVTAESGQTSILIQNA